MIVTVLRRRLIFAPVTLSSVVKYFDGLEHIFDFYKLVQEYLPEDLEKLMAKDAADAAEEFAKLFSKRYFPIMRNRDIYGESVLVSITKQVAVEWYGLRPWDYDSTYGQVVPARLLASVICVCPVKEASRIPVLERFQEEVGDLKLPVKGLPLARVENLLEGSPYPGLLLWCKWLFSETGNVWLDTAGRSPSPDWDRETVDQLTADWVTYPEMEKQMTEFSKWLEVDVKKRSAEILKYIRGKPRTLTEVFEHENKEGK